MISSIPNNGLRNALKQVNEKLNNECHLNTQVREGTRLSLLNVNLLINRPDTPNRSIPIDYVSLIDLKTQRPKTKEALALDIFSKVITHLASINHPNVHISNNGTKFHIMPDSNIKIDASGYILFAGKRMVQKVTNRYKPCHIDYFRTSTIFHLKQSGSSFIMQDCLDETEATGYSSDTDTTLSVDPSRITPSWLKEAARSYQGDYLLLTKKDNISE